MRIIRRQSHPDHLLTRAEHLIKEAMGRARHLLDVVPGEVEGERVFQHALSGHPIGTPKDGLHAAKRSALVYSENFGVRYVDYVFNDLIREPVLEVHLVAETAKESYVVHDDSVQRLAQGLTISVTGSTAAQGHGLVLAATLHHLNLTYGLSLSITAFQGANDPEQTSHAVITAHEIVLAVKVFGTAVFGTVEDEEGTLIANFVPTDSPKSTWVLLNIDAAQEIAGNFHPDDVPA